MKFHWVTNSGLGFEWAIFGPVSLGVSLFMPRFELMMRSEHEAIYAGIAIGPVVLAQVAIQPIRVSLAILNCYVCFYWGYD